MPDTGNLKQQNRYRFLFASGALFVIFLIILFSIQSFRLIYASPFLALANLALCGLAALISIQWGGIGLRKIGLLIFSLIAAAGAVLAALVTKENQFLALIVCYAGYAVFANWVDRKRADELVIREIEIEKQSVEKNDLEITFKEKGKNISVYFEKYSAYYNLRRLADEFATTLEFTRLADLIVSRTLEFIQKGSGCLLFLASPDQNEISLIASKSSDSQRKPKKKLGDLFDFWVLRHRQHLLVADTQKDFRFDLKKTAALEDVRSAILSPLLHEGKVAGTLRIEAEEPDVFNTDHLRFLDAISTLASSALSNALLYQKTEELAIRDSLTHLYVQRYFLERLKEEHKRALLTHQPLSLLMCDLDYFKRVNDQYGHAVGDLMLCRAAAVFRELCDQEIIARYGGEEFTILLPHVAKAEAYQFAEKIRARLAKERVEIRRELIQITISIGVANIPDDTLDPEELVRLADERLYQAKRAGRNRVA